MTILHRVALLVNTSKKLFNTKSQPHTHYINILPHPIKSLIKGQFGNPLELLTTLTSNPIP